MKAPRLDRRITIQKPQSSRASDGSVVEIWADFATVWAARKDIPSGRRGGLFSGDQHNDIIYTEWTTRFLTGLDGSERVVDERGVPAIVVGVPMEVGRGQYTVLIVEKGAVK